MINLWRVHSRCGGSNVNLFYDDNIIMLLTVFAYSLARNSQINTYVDPHSRAPSTKLGLHDFIDEYAILP